MHDLLKAVVLGIVEGFTEFLPISSTGHLILVNHWIAFDEQFTKMFDIVIQLGAILSVIVYFRARLFPLAKDMAVATRRLILDLWLKTFVGIIPMLVVGAVFKDQIQIYLFNPVTVAIALVVGGALLFMIENRRKNSKINSLAALSFRTAFLIGLFQCLAMIPGTSRSAVTIIGAMLLGASRVVATEFSFFLAIPTMVLVSGYSLLKAGFGLNARELLTLGTGFVTAFFVAWLVIVGFLSFVSKRDLKPFAYYRMVFGVLIMLYFGVA
jgi:undecaprenyl-diphosphatase